MRRFAQRLLVSLALAGGLACGLARNAHADERDRAPAAERRQRTAPTRRATSSRRVSGRDLASVLFFPLLLGVPAGDQTVARAHDAAAQNPPPGADKTAAGSTTPHRRVERPTPHGPRSVQAPAPPRPLVKRAR